MQNGANKKGFSKDHSVKVMSYPGTASKDVLDKIHDLMNSELDFLISPCGNKRHKSFPSA